MSNHPLSPMLRLVPFALGLIILAMFVSPILATTGNFLGQAAAFLEEISTLYAEAGGPEPDWPRPAFAGLRLPDLALLEEGDEASPASAAAQMPPAAAPASDVQASGVVIDQLTLDLSANPAQVAPGQVMTVSLRLANAGPSALNEVTLSAFLPPALQYQASLGEPPPGYDPRLRMLAWQVGTLAPGAVLELGYQAQVASEASPGALTLPAEAGAAGLATSLEASATISVEQVLQPTPTPRFEPPLAGPPARIQLAVEPVRDEKKEDPGQPRPYWLAVYVVDAGGLAVADGTQVQLRVTGGEPAQTTPRTRGGIATTRLDVPPGQALTITAQAGEARGSLAIGEETGEQVAAQVGYADDRYGARARALVAARNAFSRDGAGLAAENRTRRLSLDGPNLDFTLKGQQAGDESLALSFQLTGLRVGQTPLTPSPSQGEGWGGGELRANRATYQPPGASWQVVYEAGDASVEQYFLFEKGTPVDGDLVIEGVFDSALQPVFLSDEEGIRFYQVGREAEEAEAAALGYGPARVRDAGGRETVAHMELQGKRLRIVVPAAWLARAEFPVLVDPVIGPAELVSELQGAVYVPDAASNGSHFLAVWEDDRPGTPGTDIYGQVISADGSLLGSDFALSSASGYQYDPVLAYGQASGVYLAAWWDKRDGVQWDIYGQVISGTGVLSGSNFAISTASGNQEYPDVSVRPAGGSDEFLVVWQDRRASWARDIYAQRLGADGSLLDETDTPADKTDPAVNFPLDTSNDYSERPVVAYNPGAVSYLAAWNDRDDGGVYARRYAGAMPPLPAAGFTADPTGGVVPLTVVFTDTSTGTIAGREWNFGDGETLSTTSSAPLSHTYVATGSFSVVLTAANPAGSDVASTSITVTEQTTPFLVADFEDMDLGVDPLFWLDQKWDTTDRDDFETLWAGDSRALGTQYTGSSTVYSHYAIPGWASWQDYEYTGRMKMSDADSGIGVVVYSRYPAYEEKVYILRRYAGTPDTESFHLAASGSSLQGDLQTGLTPQPGTWYHFRVQAATGPDRVTVRARVWAEGSAEPGVWQAEAYDESGTRLTAGAAGVRAAGPGSKYFDDLVVTPQRLQADFSAEPLTGTVPLTVTFTNLSTPTELITGTLWAYGDEITSTTSALTHTHTYTGAGVYTVSLTVEGPGGSDTLTRTEYITTYRPLTVTGTSPMSNGLVIAQNGVISATFGRAIDTSTVNTRTFTVRGSQTGAYEGDYTFGSVRFDAADEFKPGEEMVVNLSSGIKDLDGVSLTPYAWGIRAATLDGGGIFSGSGQSLVGSVYRNSAALGDIDGDGDLDAFVANYNASDVWVNAGAGVFTLTQSLGTGAEAVALGDLDGDGDLDAFLADTGGNEVWLNHGAQGFVLAQSMGSSSYAVALGDLNGDGYLDALVGNEDADEIWTNQGTGTFTVTQNLGNSNTDVVTLGDVNGDGYLDALVGNWEDSEVWLNTGTGVLTLTHSLGSGARALALGDLDGDGDLDAFVRENSASRVYLNNGEGGFNDSGQSLVGSDTNRAALALGDLDGDGDLDAFLAHEEDMWLDASNEVWLNDGTGIFSLWFSMADAYSVDVDLGDLDGDGDLDAFVAGGAGGEEVWLNLNRPLIAAIRAQPATALVQQQSIQVTVWVTNVNDVPIEDVQPWLVADGTRLVSGPQPISASLQAGESVTFTLAYTASESGTVRWRGGASGMDVTAGITATSPTTTSNGVSVIGAGLDWVQREPTSSPPVRGGHAIAYDSTRGVTVLFGGRNETGFLTDTWEYRGSGGWVQANPEHTPPAHWEHAMAYDSARGVTVLFGGYNAGSGLLTDTWEYDGTDWSQVISATITPSARRGHAMAYDSTRGVVVLFGGQGESGVLSDTWEYDGEWTPVSTSHRPPGCAGHAMVYDSARQVTVLFGRNPDTWETGTWEYDGSDWVYIGIEGDLWSRSGAGMAYDSRRGMAVLFGGETPAANGYETNTWEYDGAWTEVNTDHSPPGRQAHAMAYDSNRGKVVLFGGGTGGANWYMADTWEYGVFTQPVAAGFSASPLIGTAPLTVTFSDQSSGAVDSLHWDYGDGANSTTSALTHTHPYTQLGTYTVTLTVNGLGGTDTQTATIRVVSQTYTTTTRVITYTYDKLYRLTDADYSSGESFAYGYDPVGNRTVQTRTLTATTGGASTRYVQVQGQVLAQQDSGAWTHILPNHLGSVRQLVGSDSQVDLAQSFDPFGVPFETSGSGESDFGYTGEWWDSEAGLLYLRARYYDPVVGRFVSKDLWEGNERKPQSLLPGAMLKAIQSIALIHLGNVGGPLSFYDTFPIMTQPVLIWTWRYSSPGIQKLPPVTKRGLLHM